VARLVAEVELLAALDAREVEPHLLGVLGALPRGLDEAVRVLE